MTDTPSPAGPGAEPDRDPELDPDNAARPEQAPPPEPARSLTQRLRAQLGRLRKPPRQIFANGRIYGRIRISTVAVTVAFLAVLWVYLQVRPAPTVPTRPDQTTQQDVDTRTTRAPLPATTEEDTQSATPTPTPTATDSEETTGSPSPSPSPSSSSSPSPAGGAREDGAGGVDQSSPAAVPTSAPPSER